MSYLSKLGHIAHYKSQNTVKTNFSERALTHARARAHTHTHTHTHAHTHIHTYIQTRALARALANALTHLETHTIFIFRLSLLKVEIPLLTHTAVVTSKTPLHITRLQKHSGTHRHTIKGKCVRHFSCTKQLSSKLGWPHKCSMRA